jgi:hypothetical protein
MNHALKTHTLTQSNSTISLVTVKFLGKEMLTKAQDAVHKVTDKMHPDKTESSSSQSQGGAGNNSS